MHVPGTLNDKPLASTAQVSTDALYTKIIWRLIPLLFICYMASQIDRVSISYAQLQMKEALGFSDAVYGFGAGLFFVTYAIFEVPSTMLMSRIGFKGTLFRIMALWGVVTVCTAFVRTPTELYIARLALGASESGLFPAVMLYLSYWFPPARLGRVTAIYMSAIVASGFVAGPVSGWILQSMDGINGLRAWQWVFILEGIPSVILGALTLLLMHDRPGLAPWLDDAERAAIQADIDAANAHEAGGLLSFASAFKNPKIYLWGLALSCVTSTIYGITFWLPQIIHASAKLNYKETGLYSVIPYLVTFIFMLWLGHHAERKREYRWHFALSALVGALGLGLSVVATSLPMALMGLSIGNAGLVGSLPVFWPNIVGRLGRRAAPSGISLAGALGVSSAFLGPMIVGWVKTSFGEARYGMFPLIGLGILGVVVFLASTRDKPIS